MFIDDDITPPGLSSGGLVQASAGGLVCSGRNEVLGTPRAISVTADRWLARISKRLCKSADDSRTWDVVV